MLLIAAVSGQSDSAFEWGLRRATELWGPVWETSPLFDFSETSYYESTMGAGLKKQFWAFDDLMDPGELARHKIESNRLESELAESGEYNVQRPINIDAGYITEAKLVLATTKDRDHRIYLHQGIFAEVTLYYHRKQWHSRPWTYPDYQRSDFQEFLTHCRNELRRRYRDLPPAPEVRTDA